MIFFEQMDGIQLLGKSKMTILKEFCDGWLMQDETKRHNDGPIGRHDVGHVDLN